MTVYRCKVCGYLHVGETPEKCPMCDAPGSLFSEYEVPDLKGTKTYDNLAAAFAGESQANRKYTLWRQIAEAQGVPENIIAAFDRPLAEETAHATSHAVYMGMFGDTSENLESAANGENYEKTTMYPDFAEVAEKEGFSDVAQYFRAVGRFEAQHEAGYRAAKAELDAR